MTALTIEPTKKNLRVTRTTRGSPKPTPAPPFIRENLEGGIVAYTFVDKLHTECPHVTVDLVFLFTDSVFDTVDSDCAYGYFAPMVMCKDCGILFSFRLVQKMGG